MLQVWSNKQGTCGERIVQLVDPKGNNALLRVLYSPTLVLWLNAGTVRWCRVLNGEVGGGEDDLQPNKKKSAMTTPANPAGRRVQQNFHIPNVLV